MPGVTVHPPAAAGDVAHAVGAGARAIGLVDGVFGDVAAVWHKEILFALSRGVTVMGAASMGALRAAECSAFGMIGIGEVFRRYQDGRLDDDAAVAQLHAPPELGCTPLTEALVNVDATVEALSAEGDLAPDTAVRILSAARSLHFRRRTWDRILDCADLDTETRLETARLVRSRFVNLKRMDALLLCQALVVASTDRRVVPDWHFNATGTFNALLSSRSEAMLRRP
nr:TfuA-like protein [Chthonobacter albigriseus]